MHCSRGICLSRWLCSSRYKRDAGHSRKKRQSFDQKGYDRMMSIIMHKTSINKDNCASFKPDELHLPGDVGYNVEVLFSNQARTALRLSHFLSNFLQNIDMYEEYGNLRGDRLLNIEQVCGAVHTCRKPFYYAI